MDLISIIVPVYNVEKYIKQCVDSILNQSYSNIEVILVDDGSPDNCPRICDEYALIDKRVKVIHKKNSGVSAARNTGIEESSGKYIMFCDSDDYVHPKWCEELHKAISNDGVDLGICGYVCADIDNTQIGKEKIYSTKESVEIIRKDQFFNLYEREFINMPWNKIFKRNVIINNDLRMDSNIQYNEDLLFVMEYIKSANGNFAFVNKGLNFYRKNVCNSLTNRYVDKLWEIKKEVFQVMEDTFDSCSIDIKSIEKKYYNKWIWSIMYCFNNNELSNSMNNRKKYMYNKSILKSVECKKALKYASFEGFDPIYIKVLRTRVYLFVYIFRKILKIKNRLLKK